MDSATSRVQQLEEVAQAGVHVQMLEAGMYDENADSFLPVPLYECAVTLDPDLSGLEPKCTIQHSKSSSHSLDLRPLVAHKISTLLWINSMPKVRQKGLVCLGLADKDRPRLPMPQPGGSSVEVDVSLSLRGDRQLSTLLLNNPSCMREVRRSFCVAVPDWRGAEHAIQLIQIVGGYRRAVLRFDMDVASGRPRLEQFDATSLATEHRRFYKYFTACAVVRTLDRFGLLQLQLHDMSPPSSRAGTPPLSPVAIANMESAFIKYGSSIDDASTDAVTEDVESNSDSSRLTLTSDSGVEARNLQTICDLLALETSGIASGPQATESSHLWTTLLYGVPLPISYLLFMGGWDVVVVLLAAVATGTVGVAVAVVAALWSDLTVTEMVEELSWYCEPHPDDPNVMHCFLAVVTKVQYYCVEQLDKTVQVKPYSDFDSILADRHSEGQPQLYAYARAARNANDQPCVSIVRLRRAAQLKTNSVVFAQELFSLCCQRNKSPPSKPWWLSCNNSSPPTPRSSPIPVRKFRERRRNSLLSIHPPTFTRSSTPPPSSPVSNSSFSSFYSCLSPLPANNRSMSPMSLSPCHASGSLSPLHSAGRQPLWIPDIALSTMPVLPADPPANHSPQRNGAELCQPAAPPHVPGPRPSLSPPRSLPTPSSSPPRIPHSRSTSPLHIPRTTTSPLPTFDIPTSSSSPVLSASLLPTTKPPPSASSLPLSSPPLPSHLLPKPSQFPPPTSPPAKIPDVAPSVVHSQPVNHNRQEGSPIISHSSSMPRITRGKVLTTEVAIPRPGTSFKWLDVPNDPFAELLSFAVNGTSAVATGEDIGMLHEVGSTDSTGAYNGKRQTPDPPYRHTVQRSPPACELLAVETLNVAPLTSRSV